jgi:hypothetical protein
MKRLLFGGFIALSLLRLSYAESLCKDDLDCFVKYANTKDINYLMYGCNNYKNQSYGRSCMRLYSIFLDNMKRDIVDFCDKGNSMACSYKIIYNLDGKFRDETTVMKETFMILKQSEQRCENEEDVTECIVAHLLHKFLGNSERAKYYYDKGFKIFMNTK